MKATELIDEIHRELYEPQRATGDQLLAVGVLRRALMDVFAVAISTESERELNQTEREALSWFFTDKDKGFTFGMVCEILELDRDYALRRVKTWIESEGVNRGLRYTPKVF